MTRSPSSVRIGDDAESVSADLKPIVAGEIDGAPRRQARRVPAHLQGLVRLLVSAWHLSCRYIFGIHVIRELGAPVRPRDPPYFRRVLALLCLLLGLCLRVVVWKSRTPPSSWPRRRLRTRLRRRLRTRLRRRLRTRLRRRLRTRLR